MKMFVLPLFAGFFFLAGCGDRNPASSETAAPNLEDVIAQNTTALGGATALDAVKTMVKRSLIEEGDDRDIAVFATDRAGRMRVDIFTDGARVFAESYDGAKGHQWRPSGGETEASEQGTAALAHTPQKPNHIFRLKDMAAKGHALALLDTEAIDGARYYVLKLTLDDGFESYLFVDAETGFVTRIRNKRALHVDVDDTQRVIEERISDFRPVGGIVHPHLVEEIDLATGETLTRITLQDLKINETFSDDYFTDLTSIVPPLTD